MGESVFMREIKTVADALEWFDEDPKFEEALKVEKDPKFESDYRKPVDCGMPNGFSLAGEPNGYYNGFNAFEPDSCPEAWKHYAKHYTTSTFGFCGDTSATYRGKEYTLNETERKYTFCKLGYSGEKPNIRLHAVPQWRYNQSYTNAKRSNNTFDASRLERLGGDCDFNFNHCKYPMLLTTLFNTAASVTKENVELLIKCHDMHHTLLNFSLMQGSGAMQLVKQDLDKDRVDRLLFFINRYYTLGDRRLLSRAKNLTYEHVLRNYLYWISKGVTTSEKIYRYCALIYFLPTKNHYTSMMIEKKVNIHDTEYQEKWNTLLYHNQQLIKDLLTSGTMFIDTSDRVVDYMLLAVRFWQAKETYFTLMDAILKDAKKNE